MRVLDVRNHDAWLLTIISHRGFTSQPQPQPPKQQHHQQRAAPAPLPTLTEMLSRRFASALAATRTCRW